MGERDWHAMDFWSVGSFTPPSFASRTCSRGSQTRTHTFSCMHVFVTSNRFVSCKEWGDCVCVCVGGGGGGRALYPLHWRWPIFSISCVIWCMLMNLLLGYQARSKWCVDGELVLIGMCMGAQLLCGSSVPASSPWKPTKFSNRWPLRLIIGPPWRDSFWG